MYRGGLMATPPSEILDLALRSLELPPFPLLTQEGNQQSCAMMISIISRPPSKLFPPVEKALTLCRTS